MSSKMKVYNLLHEKWLPAKRHSGHVEWIAPHQITEGYDIGDPFVALDVPRADFNGALLEFLIGLLSTAFTPENEAEKCKYWEAPPESELLSTKFEKYVLAFNLNGDGPRFMQDMDPLDGGKEEKIAHLLIDAPGDQTIKQNKDLFFKRSILPENMCCAAVAMALYTLQTYSPEGGRGHRTSLRGGGPLTTLLVAKDPLMAKGTLWASVWPNVLTKKYVKREKDLNIAAAKAENIFPWLSKTRTSESKNHQKVTRKDMSPLHIFWGMPRRIRLDFVQQESETDCGILPVSEDIVVHKYRTKSYGMDYSGGWKHALSPYSPNKDDEFICIHPNENGISYRQWVDFSCPARDGKGSLPAEVFRFSGLDIFRDSDPYIFAFGYHTDSAKICAWVESEMRISALTNAKARKRISKIAERMIKASNFVVGRINGAVVQALQHPSKEKSKEFPKSLGVSDDFWRATEGEFFDLIDDIARDVNTDDTTEDTNTKDDKAAEKWRKVLHGHSLGIYDKYISMYTVADGNMEQAVRARYRLNGYLTGKEGTKLGRKLFEILRGIES